MMYRPQFVYPPAPADCWDQRFHYAYDATNTPFLNSGTLAAGAHTGRIPLQMDQDAPFLFLAVQQWASFLQLRLETPYGDPLSDSGNRIETTNYCFVELFDETDGGPLVTLEGDTTGAGGIWCPRGGVLNLYLNNPTAAPVNMNTVRLVLHGKKRYSKEFCL